MAGIRLYEHNLRVLSPHTFNSLQHLVMSMAAVHKNAGKKTFFGRDKGQDSYSKFLVTLRSTLQSMLLDGLVKQSTSSEEVLKELNSKLEQFALAFPNWQDAYEFAAFFFGDAKEATATIERLRSF
jgi:hypothetical protein